MNISKFPKLSIGRLFVPLCVLIFLIPIFIALFSTGTKEASAAVHNIDQCYDSSNTTDAVFQIGLFVTNGAYQTGTTLQANDIIKDNWQYTYFSGNGADEVNSLTTTPGDVNVTISSVNAPNPINQVVSMPQVGKYTLLAHGSGDKQPIEYTSFPDDLTPITVGKGKIRVIHVSGYDTDLENLNLDVRLTGTTQPLIDSLAYGSQGFFEVDPGDISLQAVDQSGQFVVFDMKPFNVADGQLVTLILYGDDADSLDVYHTVDCVNVYRYNQLINPPQFPGEVGEVRFVNLAPLSSNLADTELEFSLNGDSLNTSVEYGETTDYVQLVAQTYSVQVSEPGEDVADGTTFPLESGKDYTIVASGGGSADTPIRIAVIEDLVDAPAGNQTSLRIGNFLSDAEDPSEINVNSTNNVIEVNGLDRLEFGTPEFADYPSGEYDLSVISGPRTLIDPQPITFANGSIETLLAAGNGIEQPFGVYRLTGRNQGEFVPLNSSRLYVAHLAPFANTVAGTAVTLEIDGDAVSDFSTYGDSTGYLTLSSGSHNVEIMLSDTTVASQDVDLTAGEDYTLIFTGSNSTLGFSPLAVDDNQTQPNEDSVHLRVGNAAPFVSGAAFAALDFADQTSSIQQNVGFGSIGPVYISRPAGEIDLSISLADSSDPVIDPRPITFTNGDIVTLIAAGGDTAFDKSVFVIENGQKGYFLDVEVETAGVYFANLMALSSNLSETEVSLKVDGEIVLQEVKFGSSSDGYIAITPGTVQVEVIQTGNADPILSE
ncbi:MAG: DUF4397 domain-containing protein, partial [Chloroflexota bacterium]